MTLALGEVSAMLESNMSAPWVSIKQEYTSRLFRRLFLVLENQCAKLRGCRGGTPTVFFLAMLF